jgi:hypothetical protein
MPRKPKALSDQSSEFAQQVNEAAHVAAVAIAHNFPKPIVVDVLEFEVGDLEFLESIQELDPETRISAKYINEFMSHFCKNWTPEDVRKLKMKDWPAARDAVYAAMSNRTTVPNGSETNS